MSCITCMHVCGVCWVGRNTASKEDLHDYKKKTYLKVAFSMVYAMKSISAENIVVLRGRARILVLKISLSCVLQWVLEHPPPPGYATVTVYWMVHTQQKLWTTHQVVVLLCGQAEMESVCRVDGTFLQHFVQQILPNTPALFSQAVGKTKQNHCNINQATSQLYYSQLTSCSNSSSTNSHQD